MENINVVEKSEFYLENWEEKAHYELIFSLCSFGMIEMFVRIRKIDRKFDAFSMMKTAIVFIYWCQRTANTVSYLVNFKWHVLFFVCVWHEFLVFTETLFYRMFFLKSFRSIQPRTMHKKDSVQIQIQKRSYIKSDPDFVSNNLDNTRKL